MTTTYSNTTSRYVTIIILPYSIKIRARKEESILSALRKSGITIDALCGGRGLCGKCRIRVVKGETNSPTSNEVRILGDLIKNGWRLACQVMPKSDLEVEVPSFKGQILDWAPKMKFPLDPAITLIPIENIRREPPSNLDTLLKELKTLGITNVHISLQAIKNLVLLSRMGIQGNIVYNRDYNEIIDIKTDEACYGLAIDLGTTTIVISLVNLRNGVILDTISEYNGQITYGRDIISRIGYAMTARDGLLRLHRAMLETINKLLVTIFKKNNVEERAVYEVAAAGNTVMSLLFLGLPPHNLGSAPFEPPFLGGYTITNDRIGLKINPDAKIHLLPVLGGYVGGDVVGDIISSGMLNDEVALLIDLGTNGEVVLKKAEIIYVTSCAAGPAFEGVGISSGMMAIEGAIERIRLKEELEPEYSVIGGGRARGICGSGLIDILAEMVRHSIIDKQGRIKEVDNPRIRRNKKGSLEFVIEWKEATAVGKDIVVTQQDVRQLQLAKAAIKTAYKILLNKTNTRAEELKAVYVAGGFGNFLNKENALLVGLVPKVDISKVKFIGNGSLAGARMFLLSRKVRSRVRELLKNVIHISLHEEPNFRRLFIESLFFE